MTEKTIEDLDLHAYVDGLLDDDPGRKAAVEAYLRHSPEAMHRVEDFKTQNAALQKAFGPRIADPVPQRLYDALDVPPRQRSQRVALRAAAMTAALFAAGLTGWMAGLGVNQDRMISKAVDQSYQQFAAAPSADTPKPAPGIGAFQAVDPRMATGETSIGLHAPDLSQAGYRLTQERQVSTSGTDMVRLDYDAAGAAGMAHSASSTREHGFSLFLAPRWSPDPDGVKAAERDGVSIVYWLEGPYISTLVTRMPQAEAERTAAAVREAMAAERRQPVPSGGPAFDTPTPPPSPIQPSTGQATAPAAQPLMDAVPLQINSESVQH